MGGDNCNGAPPFKRMKRHVPVVNEALPQKEAFPNGMEMAGVSAPLDNQALGSQGQINKVEFVKLITEALYSLGFENSAALLEKEAAIPLRSDVVSQFRKQILEGLWDESIKTLHKICPLDPDILKAAAFLILQKKFLELLQKGNITAALNTLRSEIAKLQIQTQRVHELASSIICPFRKDLSGEESWRGTGAEANKSLLLELQSLLPSEIMIPEKRLEGLIEQALYLQRKECVFHNSPDQALSLYTDHRCGRDDVPSETIQVLDAHNDEVWFLQFSHSGSHLASGSKDCTAIIWEVKSDNFLVLKHTLTGHQKPISFVAWSPNDAMLLTCGTEEAVKLWDVKTGVCLRTYTKKVSGFTSCAWFPIGHQFVCGGGDKCIDIWSLTGEQLSYWNVARMPRITDVAVTSDMTYIISISGDKDIRFYNMKEKAEKIVEEDASVTSLSVSKDGKYLLVSLASQELHLWDITMKVKLPYKYKGHRQGRYVVRSCFGGSDQGFIVSGSEDSQVYIWHRGNGDLLGGLPGHAGTVNSVSWNSQNPHMFASASDDHTIRIWGVRKRTSIVSSNGNGRLMNGLMR